MGRFAYIPAVLSKRNIRINQAGNTDGKDSKGYLRCCVLQKEKRATVFDRHGGSCDAARRRLPSKAIIRF